MTYKKIHLDTDAEHLKHLMIEFQQETFNGKHHEGCELLEQEILDAWEAACQETGYFTHETIKD